MIRRCCGKRRYATRQAAEAALRRIAALPHAGTTYTPVRAYQCHHGWWHLTSQPAPRWVTPARTEENRRA